VTKPSQKGLTGPTAKVLDDVAAFIKDKLPSDVPVFVMGHSMGGAEVLTMMGESQYEDLVGQVRGWILESPFVAFTPGQEPSNVKVVLGRLAGRWLPNFQLKHIVPPETLSRDPAVVKSVRDDPLCHDTGTLEGMSGILDRTMLLASGTVKVSKRVKSVLLAHGSDDMVCSHDAAMEWLKNQDIEDKTAKSYKGGYHQLHTDYCKEEFGNDMVDWILKRTDTSASTGEAKQSKPTPSESKL
jgi:acylglycerol lipase